MAREGTRSATGNSKPRVFQQVDTAPTIKRSRQPKTAGLLGGKTGKTTGTTTAPGAGVIAPKKKTTTAKKPGVVAKAKAVVKKITPGKKGTTKKTTVTI